MAGVQWLGIPLRCETISDASQVQQRKGVRVLVQHVPIMIGCHF